MWAVTCLEIIETTFTNNTAVLLISCQVVKAVYLIMNPHRPLVCCFSFLYRCYSYTACCEFLRRNNLLSIIRAHEAQDAG